jgi:septal ring factor EnvC (AmiA/AmiB activator)
LDRIKELETELERLKKLTPKELVDKLSAKEKEINDLKFQLTQLQQQNGQLVAQIEVKETKR